ncbi:MAG: hypothetical protein DLM64_11005 [Solirubrobacterales bacterium]|nr:MAG: hypothetical protein DLM64_11005 [Solirubrobacterales bacterium]
MDTIGEAGGTGERPTRRARDGDWGVAPLGGGQRPSHLRQGVDWDVDRLPRWPDRTIGQVATKQLGLVTHDQLVALGLGNGIIDHAVASGRLSSIHRGVYALAHLALLPLATELAAVLACGEEAFVSHQSAAAVWGIRPGGQGEVEVTVVARDVGRRRKGIHVHRAAVIDPVDLGRHRGIPITAPARTLLDVAAARRGRELERAFDEALVRRLVSEASVRAVLRRYPGRRGSRPLSALVDGGGLPAMTRSQAEELFLELLRKAGLPRPAVNASLGRYEVDFLWRAERLVVEIDGFTFHRERGAFEADRHRDAELKAAGFTVLRFTWRQLVHEHEVILVRLGQMMPPALSGRAG